MDTVVIDVPNSRAIAKQLLTLAQDPENQPFIVQEQGCLAGLVQYTQHDDIDVVLIATRALQFLSTHPSNKTEMRDFPNLVSNLTSAYERGKEHPKVKEFVSETLENLHVCAKLDDSFEEENGMFFEDDAENQSFVSNVMNRRASFGSIFGKAVSPKQRQDLGEYRNVTFMIKGGIEDREIVEKTLIQVNGIISVTLNAEKTHVTVGTRAIGDEFIDEATADLDAIGLEAKVVPSLSAKGTATDDGSNIESVGVEDDDFPDYLDEDDFEDEDEDYSTGLTRHGFSSLESRLEEQRKKQSRPSMLMGMLNNAASWLAGH